MRALVLALALAAGCDEVLPTPDFGSLRPYCPSSPMAGASCDPVSEPYCAYPTEQMKCTCETQKEIDVFVCASTALDMSHTD